MRLINRSRQSGKTSMLIHTAYITGYPIIVTTLQRKDYVKKQAIDMGCNDIDVYTLEEWNGQVNNQHRDIEKNVLIDEVEDVLNNIINEYLNANVIAATLTLAIDDARVRNYEDTK